MNRRDKNNYYLDIAQGVLERSTCMRRAFGAIIVNNDEIISTGYNGSPRGRKNCDEIGECMREKLNIPRGMRYEVCRSVHAEANAIISAARKDMIGGLIYIVGIEMKTGEYVKNPNACAMCKRLIINSGINKIILRLDKDEYKIINVYDWIDSDDSLQPIEGY